MSEGTTDKAQRVRLTDNAGNLVTFLRPDGTKVVVDDEYRRKSGDHKHGREGIERRKEFVQHLRDGASIQEACKMVGVQFNTYRKWRDRFPPFRAEVDAARAPHLAFSGVDAWEHGFAAFRKRFFGMDSPAFHLRAIEVYETLEPGAIGMILFPPEFGKTTLFEDYASYKLAVEPTYRFAVGSETIDIARKMVGRVMNRMEPDGGFREYVNRWGPFVPQKDSNLTRDVVWSADKFRVWKARSTDERDFSMSAYGMKSGILSTRTDHFHVDDAQSTMSLTSTDRYFTRIRQDWFSRAGAFGRVVINGSRVGDDDIYERFEAEQELIDEGLLKIVKFRALQFDDQGNASSLWPERYPLDVLERIKKKVGQEAWDRNYMMDPGASDSDRRAFREAYLQKCVRPDMHMLVDDPDVSAGNRWAVISLDPAIGSKNCFMSLEFGPHLKVLNIREDEALRNNEEIMGKLLEELIFLQSKGYTVTDLVIEAKNFQAGLARDERLQELATQWGFRISEHLTGVNKYDENIGVYSMTQSFAKGEIDIPYAATARTRNLADELLRQLRAWKPLARGNKLRQDQVMALWFAWIVWRSRRKLGIPVSAKEAFKVQTPQPIVAARPSLILPIGVRL